MNAVENLTDAELTGCELAQWPFRERPFSDVVAWVNSELMKNAAEIGTNFVNDPRGVNKTSTPTSSTYTVRDAAGNLIGFRDSSGNRWYYLQDRLGSTLAVINNTGLTVGNRYAYDEWGRSTYTCTTLCTGPVAQPWGYAAGLTDPTGLIKFGARYYSPDSGRWTQLDPSGQDPGYTYVGGDPCNRTDPSGLSHNGYTPCAGRWYTGVRFLSAGSWLRTGWWWANGNVPKARGEFIGSLESGNKYTAAAITKFFGKAVGQLATPVATGADAWCAVRQAEANDQGWVNAR